MHEKTIEIAENDEKRVSAQQIDTRSKLIVLIWARNSIGLYVMDNVKAHEAN